MPSAKKIYGEIIKQLRRSKGLKQKVVAERANLKLGQYREIENGKADPELSEIMAISLALRTKPSTIMTLVSARLK